MLTSRCLLSGISSAGDQYSRRWRVGEFGATSFLARLDQPTVPVVIYVMVGFFETLPLETLPSA